jgi:hypothetical protein
MDHAVPMALRLTTQEAVMGQVIPRQHPAVVLRSQYKAVLAMLCVSLVAIVALATTLVIVANDDNETAISAQPSAQQQTLPPGTRFDRGPDEGTRGPQSYWQSSNPRSSYQPAPDDGFKERAGGPTPRTPGAQP